LHLDELKREIVEFLDGETYTVMEEDDPEPGVRRAVVRNLAPIPNHWPLVIGDALHNLRSALDHAITDLTVAHHGSRLDKTEFPVFTDDGDFDRTKKTGEPAPGSGIFKIRGVDPASAKLIRDLQPFNFTDKSNITVLQLVHDLNLEDKHRALHVLRSHGEGGEVRWLRDTQPIEITMLLGNPIEDGSVLGRWMPVSPAPGEPDMKFTINAVVMFGPDTPHFANRRVDETGDMLIRGVRRILGYLDGSIPIH
jgi:hypothetical protein